MLTMNKLVHGLKFFEGKKPLIQLRQHIRKYENAGRVPVFAYDVNQNGTKLFCLSGAYNFASYYSKMKHKKHFYEVLEHNIPLKLYFDIEFEMPSKCKIETCISIICEQVNKMLQREVKYVELDSSSDTKASRHLIFNCLFCDRENMKSFVNELINILRERYEGTEYVFDGSVCGIDNCVYTPARCFRLLGSSKYGKSRVLKLVRDGKILEGYTRRDLMESLISVYLLDDDDIVHDRITALYYDESTIDEVQRFKRSEIIEYKTTRPTLKRKCENKTFEHVDIDVSTMVSNIKKTLINDHYPEALKYETYETVSTCKHKRQTTLSISFKGIQCNNTRRVHKNNRVFLNIDITYIDHDWAPGFFVCTDEVCKADKKHIWSNIENYICYINDSNTIENMPNID